MKPITTPATVAVTQMSTAPRIESSGSAAEAPGSSSVVDVPGTSAS